MWAEKTKDSIKPKIKSTKTPNKKPIIAQKKQAHSVFNFKRLKKLCFWAKRIDKKQKIIGKRRAKMPSKLLTNLDLFIRTKSPTFIFKPSLLFTQKPYFCLKQFLALHSAQKTAKTGATRTFELSFICKIFTFSCIRLSF